MKNETNHTLGAWEVTNTHAIDARGNKKPSGVFITKNGEDIAYIPIGENRYGNARLIAAAPDLLAALQDLVRARQDFFDAMPSCWETFDGIARAAIEKATGKGEA